MSHIHRPFCWLSSRSYRLLVIPLLLALALPLLSSRTPAQAADPQPVLLKEDISHFGGMFEFNGMIFFLSGSSLWKTDGTEAGTIFVTRSNSSFTAAGDTLFFTADDGTHGEELWKTDGTEAGTVLVKDIYPGGNTSNPEDFTVVGETLFFTADDGTPGSELWASDGTEAGTVLLVDSDYIFDKFTVLNNTFLFVMDDGTHGHELWKSDGTEAGTVLVKDIYPGANNSDLGNFTMVGDTLVFVANDGTHGAELWKTDGTEAGTVLVKDINPGTGGSWPSQG